MKKNEARKLIREFKKAHESGDKSVTLKDGFWYYKGYRMADVYNKLEL